MKNENIVNVKTSQRIAEELKTEVVVLVKTLNRLLLSSWRGVIGATNVCD